MHLAAWHGHAQVCEALYQLCPHLSCHSARDRRSRTPLHLAAMGGWPATAQLLIDFAARTPSAANEAARARTEADAAADRARAILPEQAGAAAAEEKEKDGKRGAQLQGPKNLCSLR